VVVLLYLIRSVRRRCGSGPRVGQFTAGSIPQHELNTVWPVLGQRFCLVTYVVSSLSGLQLRDLSCRCVYQHARARTPLSAAAACTPLSRWSAFKSACRPTVQ
jgi:hypothetical protein